MNLAEKAYKFGLLFGKERYYEAEEIAMKVAPSLGLSVPSDESLLKLTDLPSTLNTASAHDTNLATALNTLRRFGAVVPDDSAVDIIAIEAEEVMIFSETCTPAVEASIGPATEMALRLVEAFLQNRG